MPSPPPPSPPPLNHHAATTNHHLTTLTPPHPWIFLWIPLTTTFFLQLLKLATYKIGVKLDENIYQESLSSCKFMLLGKLLSKGASPLNVGSFHNIISSTLKLKDNWKLCPLGKGLYSDTTHGDIA